ncbi:Shedu immune nuclease family protein [Tenacibaculum maritimum]|uniref:Shedu immune nuclease family protein n=1 Tax=Tenacibaculum maritimum TaxID=107401 RepID=UPI00388D9B1D
MPKELTDFDYFINKKTDAIYLSKSLSTKVYEKNENGEINEKVRPIRIASLKMENEETHKFYKKGKEIALRVTPNGTQEIKAKYYEDSKGIFNLTIQKFTTETGSPHNTYFSFRGNEIKTLVNFIKNVSSLPTEDKYNKKFDIKAIEKNEISKSEILDFLKTNPELINEIVKSNLTKEEIINLSYRKQQIDVFEKLLKDENYFNQRKKELGINRGIESVWQDFFERNTWIFGYGLDYIFNSPINNKKLEQVVSGYNFNNSGKRIDALMKTRGIINSFCFGELKTHKTKLLKEVKDPYRGESWAISDELAGAISQTQKSVQKSIKELTTKVEIKDKTGNLTGEQIFIYQPKSFVIIGNLSEFKNDSGINEDKFSSFELFRQNQISPEIITFDELFERAKYIIRNNEKNESTNA